jgi:hypothetical protein
MWHYFYCLLRPPQHSQHVHRWLQGVRTCTEVLISNWLPLKFNGVPMQATVAAF